MKKRLIWIIAGLALIALIVIALMPTPIPVETAAARRGAMTVTIDADGVTRVRDLFVVAAPTSGRLERIELEEGEIIAVNQRIGTIYPAPINPAQKSELEAQISAIEASRKSAEANVSALSSQLEQAQREVERMRSLFDAGAIAKREVEQAELSVRTLNDQIDGARNVVRSTAEQAAAARSGRAAYGGNTAGVAVVAPGGGSVLRVFEKSERVVLAGTPLVAIGDPRGLEFVVDVLSSDAVKIEAGDEIIVEGWGGDEPLKGLVRYIEPAAFTKISALGIEEQRVRVIGMFATYPDKLGDGYRVTARIVTWRGDNVISVPAGALFRDGEEWALFVVSNGTAKTRRVKTGQRNAFEVEITSGLKDGERVILHPSSQIAEGVEVEDGGQE